MDINNSSTAFVFPGQGSQKIGMGADLYKEYPIAKQIFDQADDILNFSLTNIMWEGPEKSLNDTINTQPALMVHSIAALKVLGSLFPESNPKYVAGHSMGELSSLAASGALEFERALKLVRTRGELMKKSGKVSPGGMAAILGLDIEKVENVCALANHEDEIIQVANDNCPGQVVISGSKQAVERALEIAVQEGAKKTVALDVSIAAHSKLMAPIEVEFSQAVDNANISDPTIPIVGNVNAKILSTSSEIEQDLKAQLSSRVRWTESIKFMIENGINTFIEVGTGKVLSGLIKRIDRSTNRYSLGTPTDFQTLLNSS